MSSLINSLNIDIPSPETLIQHEDKLLIIGSCFSEHMSKRLRNAKFRVMESPHGILFNPMSVALSLDQYIKNEVIADDKMIFLNETWNNWDFHSRFSEVEKELALSNMQSSIFAAHNFLKEADWLMITLGSAFQYFLKENNEGVANCHRAPGQWFEKRLLSIESIIAEMQQTISSLKAFNPNLKIIFTISPVRHIRDGVIDNNRSKARLIESVHQLVHQNSECFYFPSYELLIDILRDYRYYDVDMIHPNFAATQIVWEQFAQSYLDDNAQLIAKEMQALSTATNHKVRFPETQANAKFKSSYLNKIVDYEKRFPYINFSKEKAFFGE